jgi:DNA-binding FadR family transcriptional regulator
MPKAQKPENRPFPTSNGRSNAQAFRMANESSWQIKLPERIANQIESDIIAQGWPVGKVLGTEPELLARYSTSRATFREAIRILEHHMTAHMKRGPGGGLVVAAPDESSVAQSVALYLEYKCVKPEGLLQARKVIELACIRLLVERNDPASLDQLNQILESEETAFPHEVHARSNDFHLTIAELTQNDALELFVRVLAAISQQHISYAPSVYEQVSKEVHRAHRSIVKAMLAGDVEMAVRRMSIHLDAVTEYVR